MISEMPLVMKCGDDALVGVVHVPSNPGSVGVLVLVGGPQYRVGSHRQFVLLGRALAQAGFPVLRFDHRGIGDSSGEPRSFQDLSDDVECAIDVFLETCPQVKHVYIWGLCDAASAASLYAQKDPRVTGLVLLNPWVRSEGGFTRSFLMHYYLERLFDYRVWMNELKGSKGIWYRTISTITKFFSFHSSPRVRELNQNIDYGHQEPGMSGSLQQPAYQVRMLSALQKFQGRALIILSGNDLTAAEFTDAVKSNRKLRKLVGSSAVRTELLQGADHTFSAAEWRLKAERISVDWLGSLSK